MVVCERQPVIVQLMYPMWGVSEGGARSSERVKRNTSHDTPCIGIKNDSEVVQLFGAWFWATMNKDFSCCIVFEDDVLCLGVNARSILQMQPGRGLPRTKKRSLLVALSYILGTKRFGKLVLSCR